MDYQNFGIRMIDIGLNIRDTNDRVKEGYWTVLNNVRSTQEALIQTREGRTEEVSIGTGPVHSLRRVGSTFMTGIGENLYRGGTLLSGGYSGDTLSIIPFRQEISPNVWGFIGDTLQMRMVKEDGTDFKWGIEAPATEAAFVASADAGALDSSTGEPYDWRYTYYSSSTGAESNGSPTVTGIPVVIHKGQITVQASSDPQVDSIRLYRRGGTLISYHLVSTNPNSAGVLTDNVSDDDLALERTLSEDNFVPFTSLDSAGSYLYGVPLSKLWGPFLGRTIFACGDENRKGAVYYTNALSPTGAGRNNFVDVTGPQEPLQHGFLYGGNPFVFSQENIYGLRYGSATNLVFSPFLTPVGKGLMAPHAFCVGPLVFFLAKDGIYQTDCQGPAQSITEESMRPLFQETAVPGYNPIDLTFPEDIRMAFHGQVLHFFYRETITGAKRHLTYNVFYKRWKEIEPSVSTDTLGYSDESSGSSAFLIGAEDGSVYRVDQTIVTDVGLPIACQAKTGAISMDMPQTLKEFGNLIVDCDPMGNTITVTPSINGQVTDQSPILLTGSGRQRFAFSLGDVYAFDMSFDFAWTGDAKLYQATVQWRPDEEAITHWEFPETNHQMTGMLQVKQAYIALRSAAEVTFTVSHTEIDGTQTSNTYTIPSTGGARQKLLVQFLPTKGVLYQYQLDSASQFRLYGADCEVHVKPWKTNEGFQLVTPFA